MYNIVMEKRFLIVFGLLALFSAGAAVRSFFFADQAPFSSSATATPETIPARTPESSSARSALSASSDAAPSANDDKDKDGLKDWEETLWGTDPEDPDTDGDGTKDGAEVESSRNPLTAGPNDAIPPWITERISSQSPNSQTIPAETKAGAPAASYSLSSAADTLASPSTEEDAKDPMREYGNAIGAILSNHGRTTSEIGRVMESLVSTSSVIADKTKARALSSANQNTSRSLGAVSAPTDAFETHMNLVNSYETLGKEVARLAELTSPTGIKAEELSVYMATMQQTVKSVLGLANYFKNEGIVFAPEEPGYIFNMP